MITTTDPTSMDGMRVPALQVCAICHVAHHPRKPHIFTGRPAGAAGGKVPCTGCNERAAIIDRLQTELAAVNRAHEQLKQEYALVRELATAAQERLQTYGTVVERAPEPETETDASTGKAPLAKRKAGSTAKKRAAWRKAAAARRARAKANAEGQQL